jgi:hypothetical protein
MLCAIAALLVAMSLVACNFRIDLGNVGTGEIGVI